MKGYVRNISVRPVYALKRHILPGKSVELNVLYKEYGEKHGIEEGQPFVDWLRKIKLPNEEIWDIQMVEDLEEENKVTVTAKITQIVDGADDQKEQKKEGLSNQDKVNSGGVQMKKEWEVEEVVDLTVKQAREEIPKIKDRKILSYALTVARQRPNKETICRILEKRLNEVKVSQH
jgi:hypothetical protein